MRLMGKIAPVIKLSLVAALLTLALTAPVAQATYPGENGRIFFTGCQAACNVYSVNPDGSGFENVTDELTAPEGLPYSAGQAGPSADGKRVAFGVDSSDEAEIWLSNADGSSPLQLTNNALLDMRPSISPDGARVVWNHFPSAGDADIWVMGSDGSAPQSLFNGSATDFSPEFTPDGQWVVMSSETFGMDIRKISSAPIVPPFTSSVGIADDPALAEADPSVSPDGTRVAFSQQPVGSPFAPSDIYSVGINGGATTPIFESELQSEQYPTYSPDGTKIAFSLDGVPMISNADGSGTPTPLNIGGLTEAYDLAWAPKPVPLAALVPPTSPDVDPPKTTIDKGPKGKVRSHKVKFRFSANEAGSSFRCKLDRSKFRPCQSPKRYRHLKTGKHTFRVFAIDAAGNVDASPAKRAFTIVKPQPKGSRHAR
jgi:Tol biopolymer transport system component